MDAPHVIHEVPFSGESVPFLGPFTSRKAAEMRIFPMAVQTVGLSFVTKQTSIGGEAWRTTITVGADKRL
jgi:hypothetical protein